MEPETLCRLAASCEEARRIDDTHYEGSIKARIALVTLRAFVAGEILHTQEPHDMTVALQGHSTGIPGTFTGVATLHMRPNGGETEADYSVEVNMLGRLGALGQPLIQAAGQRLANTFAAKVSSYLGQQDSGALSV